MAIRAPDGANKNLSMYQEENRITCSVYAAATENQRCHQFFCPSAIWTCDAQDGAREEMFRQMRPLGWPGGVFSTNHDQIQNYHITYLFFGQALQEKMTRI